MYGKKYMGVLRTTVVTDEFGVVTHVISKVKTKDHSNQLLEIL
jgi:peroxiredoxin Q/BCP